MTLASEDTVHSRTYKGETYYFCSHSCLQRFDQNPQTYLGKPPAAVITAGTKETEYTCPMDPEIRQCGPGACPKCGMGLEPATIAPLQTEAEYTCPMHPEIARSEPGSCSTCGMALESRQVVLKDLNPELLDMRRRFWASVILTVPLLGIMLAEVVRSLIDTRFLTGGPGAWLQFALATPVVLWGGMPFFQRRWASVVNRSLNMFTLITIGTGTAYMYSAIATVAPGLFPESF